MKIFLPDLLELWQSIEVGDECERCQGMINDDYCLPERCDRLGLGVEQVNHWIDESILMLNKIRQVT